MQSFFVLLAALVPPQSQEQSPSRPVTQEFVPLNDIEEDDIPINNKRNSASSSDLTQVSDTSDASTQEGGDLETVRYDTCTQKNKKYKSKKLYKKKIKRSNNETKVHRSYQLKSINNVV